MPDNIETLQASFTDQVWPIVQGEARQKLRFRLYRFWDENEMEERLAELAAYCWQYWRNSPKVRLIPWPFVMMTLRSVIRGDRSFAGRPNHVGCGGSCIMRPTKGNPYTRRYVCLERLSSTGR